MIMERRGDGEEREKRKPKRGKKKGKRIKWKKE